jgi:RND family efflux transporter MFP subunit
MGRTIGRWAVLALLVAAAAGAWYWVYGRGPLVAVIAPTRGTAAEIVYATGAVEPLHWAKVTSVVRERIVAICDCEGRVVQPGDELARLDDKEIRAQLAELRAREDFATREMNRIVELVARGTVTAQTYERALSELRQVQALVAAKLERLDDYRISSPMAGIVLRRDGEVGEIVEMGQILFRVGQPTPLVIVSEVNEEDIPKVAIGQTVLLRSDAFNDRPLTGRVRDITPMGDPSTKTFRMRISLGDDTPLRIGMSVEANVVTREKAGVLLVPAEAVLAGHVFVVDGDHVRRRAVRIGIRGTRQVEIIEGLTENERIVAVADAALDDGARVRTAP